MLCWWIVYWLWFRIMLHSCWFDSVLISLTYHCLLPYLVMWFPLLLVLYHGTWCMVLSCIHLFLFCAEYVQYHVVPFTVYPCLPHVLPVILYIFCLLKPSFFFFSFSFLCWVCTVSCGSFHCIPLPASCFTCHPVYLLSLKAIFPSCLGHWFCRCV